MQLYHAGPACYSADENEQQYRRQKALAAEKLEKTGKRAHPKVRCVRKCCMDNRLVRNPVRPAM